MANSLIDYVFRALGVEYLQRDELAQVPPDRSHELPEPPRGIAVDAGIQLDLTESAMEADIEAQVKAAAFVDAVVPGNGSSGSSGGSTTSGNGSAAVPEAAPAAAPMRAREAVAAAATTGAIADVQTSSVQALLADKMGDAPLCDTCGHITVRNGSCYRCLNCGDSKGCS
jgi:ribonucleoside-diphosphate reductase alpha chain